MADGPAAVEVAGGTHEPGRQLVEGDGAAAQVLASPNRPAEEKQTGRYDDEDVKRDHHPGWQVFEDGTRGVRQRDQAPARTRSVNAGTNSSASATTPRWATSKMGADASVLTATINSASFIPCRCSGAPLM